MNQHPLSPAACVFADFHPPSRFDNPFATCWTRPGALSYRFAAGQSAEQLVAQLAAQDWQGAIVGPHGSGKSTLLETLKPVLRAAGWQLHAISLHNRQRCLPPGLLVSDARPALFVVDGYEQLGLIERARLKRRCRGANAGLLVTAHDPTNVPTLIRLAPSRRLVEQLVADLAARVSTPITAADVEACCACHGSNVRDVLFALYDRHERRRRA
jgi:hypothetical protein